MKDDVQTGIPTAGAQVAPGFGNLPIAEGQDVFLFSGQGAQKPGMGGDLVGIPEVAEVFTCASDVFGFDVAQMALIGPEATLNETYHAQAALLALSVSLATVTEAHGIEPAAVLGFSLGQISALFAAGMLDTQPLFELARFRAECMASAAQDHPGAMCALLGADEVSVQMLCDECAGSDVLVPANYNAPGQIVISGSASAIDRAQESWVGAKKKAVRLATSGAFHSPLMEDAARSFSAYMHAVEFRKPKVPLICNTDARPLDVDTVRTRLAEHLVKPVRFEESVEYLRRCGARRFIELGYGGVLVGLVKRIDRASIRAKVEDAQTLESYLLEKKSKEEEAGVDGTHM